MGIDTEIDRPTDFEFASESWLGVVVVKSEKLEAEAMILCDPRGKGTSAVGSRYQVMVSKG
jgi:hypothetical protein